MMAAMVTLATPATPRFSDARAMRVADFYETLTPATLTQLPAVYADDARFIDPFNDVSGQAAIRRVFEHMQATLHSARFEVLEATTEADRCFMLWDFHLRRRPTSAPMIIHGASRLQFAADGRVALHRDYWDSGHQLYQRLPLLGLVLRSLRRRLSAGG